MAQWLQILSLVATVLTAVVSVLKNSSSVSAVAEHRAAVEKAVNG